MPKQSADYLFGINYMKTLLTIFAALFAASSGMALELPEPSLKDARIKRITFDAFNVTQVDAALGAPTLLVLEDGEKIKKTATGFLSDCKDAKSDWCVEYEKESNRIWIKPYPTATFNPLIVETNKRVYALDLNVTPKTPTKAKQAPTYVVYFNYEAPPSSLPNNLPTAEEVQAKAESDTKALANKQKTNSDFARRNKNYSMQVIGNSQSIAPKEVFDDGRFTYFKFPNAQSVPSVFMLDESGEEAVVNTYWEKGTDFLVAPRIVQQFILRRNKETVGIWNDSFDKDGVSTPTGTTIPELKREIK
jgi:P-type conjugative transfer protein VirB9